MRLGDLLETLSPSMNVRVIGADGVWMEGRSVEIMAEIESHEYSDFVYNLLVGYISYHHNALNVYLN